MEREQDLGLSAQAQGRGGVEAVLGWLFLKEK